MPCTVRISHTGNGFCKPTKGSVHLEKVDGVGKYKDYYFLTVHSSKGNPMVAMLRSTDGYYREWNQIGEFQFPRISLSVAKLNVQSHEHTKTHKREFFCVPISVFM
jgi:hypothetical protein